MLKTQKLQDGSLFIELSRKGHVFRFAVVKHMKAEAMRQIGIMASKEEAGFNWHDADQICMAIRAAFPDPLTWMEVLKLESEVAKWKAGW